MEDPTEWTYCLLRIQLVLNNSQAFSTDSTPNEIAYGFTPNFAVDYTIDPNIDFPLAQVDATNALDFATMNMKFYYNHRHTPMFLALGDWALLRLHHGYNILSTTNRKLDQQYAGPFEVLERISRLAYRLKIPDHQKIHDVFSIAQLKPALALGSDPYNCPILDEPSPIELGTNAYEVERILDKRVIRKGRGFSTQYRIRWKGWGLEHDRWYRIQDLGDYNELIEEYEQRIQQSRS